MKFSYLAVVMPMKWLPQNTEEARTQAWAAVSHLLLPNLGKFYSRFYPASNPWGQKIESPFGVVLGREDPVTFLNVFYQAKQKREEAVAFHSVEMLSHIDLDRTQQIGETLVCHVSPDGSDPALVAHSLWHLAVMEGVLMSDCGLYYLEQNRSMPDRKLEQAVSARPGGYALCAVTLESTEGAL